MDNSLAADSKDDDRGLVAPLRIPEILAVVLRHCDRRSLHASLFVNKTWFYLACLPLWQFAGVLKLAGVSHPRRWIYASSFDTLFLKTSDQLTVIEESGMAFIRLQKLRIAGYGFVQVTKPMIDSLSALNELILRIVTLPPDFLNILHNGCPRITRLEIDTVEKNPAWEEFLESVKAMTKKSVSEVAVTDHPHEPIISHSLNLGLIRCGLAEYEGEKSATYKFYIDQWLMLKIFASPEHFSSRGFLHCDVIFKAAQALCEARKPLKFMEMRVSGNGFEYSESVRAMGDNRTVMHIKCSGMDSQHLSRDNVSALSRLSSLKVRFQRGPRILNPQSRNHAITGPPLEQREDGRGETVLQKISNMLKLEELAIDI